MKNQKRRISIDDETATILLEITQKKMLLDHFRNMKDKLAIESLTATIAELESIILEREKKQRTDD
jgi:ribosomal protein L22